MFVLNNNSVDFFRNFKFKNLKSFNTYDGVAYSCEVYHDKFKIADVRNDGDGGMTHVNYTNGGENYLNSLNIEQFHSKDLGFSVDNEYTLSDLIELAISIKKVLSKQSKSIIYLIGENIYSFSYKRTLSDIVKTNKSVIENRISDIKKSGGVVLNTNLDKIGV